LDISAEVAEALLSSRADAIITADRAGIIRAWNRVLSGCSAMRAKRRSNDLSNLIIPERLRQRHWDGYNHVIQTGHSRYAESDLLSVPAIRKDGSTISLELVTPDKGRNRKARCTGSSQRGSTRVI
jgi:hypothetical protein